MSLDKTILNRLIYTDPDFDPEKFKNYESTQTVWIDGEIHHGWMERTREACE